MTRLSQAPDVVPLLQPPAAAREIHGSSPTVISGGALSPMGQARIVPGGRRLRPYGLPPGVFLRRVLVDGVDVTDTGFDVDTSGLRGVAVELTTTTTVVTGRLANAHGMAVPGASIVIFPTENRRWSEPGTRRIKTSRTSADGTFTIIDLPPGSYLAAAAVELEDGEWASPASLDRMRIRAKAFTIGTGERVTLTLILQ